MHCVFMLYCMDDVCHTTHVCHHTVWRLCTDEGSRLGYDRTAVVVELVKAGALLDLQNTVCPYPIIHDVQEHACILSCCIYTESETTCIYLTKLKRH